MARFNIHNSTVGQINDSGDNVHVSTAAPRPKTVWQRISTMWKLIGTTVGIITGLLAWYAAHVNYGVWFFWMK